MGDERIVVEQNRRNKDINDSTERACLPRLASKRNCSCCKTEFRKKQQFFKLAIGQSDAATLAEQQIAPDAEIGEHPAVGETEMNTLSSWLHEHESANEVWMEIEFPQISAVVQIGAPKKGDNSTHAPSNNC